MIYKLLLIGVLAVNLIHPAIAENILIILGLGTYSVKLAAWPLAVALADRGHNVTLISGMDKRPYSHSNVTDLVTTSVISVNSGIYSETRFEKRKKGEGLWVFELFKSFSATLFNHSLMAKDDWNLQHVLHEGEFDLVMTTMFFGETGLAIAHRSKAKLILLTTIPFFGYLHDTLGIPDEPATIPEWSLTLWYTDNWWNRFKSFVAPIYWYVNRKLYVNPKLENIMQSVMKEDVDFHELLSKRTDLIFLFTHHSNDYGRPLPPFIISVGGTTCYDKRVPLTDEFKTILNESTNGAVYASFGSSMSISTLPPEILSSFFTMVERFPQINFIWNWNGPKPTNPNLFTFKWLPQLQILGHPNLKAFITHGGLNSMTEAAFQGVPTINIPVCSDQDSNAYRVETFETGIRLELRTLTEDILIESLNKILFDPKYATNAKRMSELFKDRPMNPVETAVYWSEFVLRNGNLSSLKPKQNVGFFQRRQWDTFTFILLPVITGIYLMSLFVRKSYWVLTKICVQNF